MLLEQQMSSLRELSQSDPPSVNITKSLKMKYLVAPLVRDCLAEDK